MGNTRDVTGHIDNTYLQSEHRLQGGRKMSFEVFEKLEAKVQQAIDTITLLQMEIDELKETNNNLNREVQNAAGARESLVRENEQLKQEQAGWQERLRALLGKMDDVQ